jgi:hypothetical protein
MTHATPHRHRCRRFHVLIVFFSLTIYTWLNLPEAALAADIPCTRQPILGREEPIIVSAGGTPQTVIAKIDTGAKYSSIDMQLARSLGLNLTDAKTVTMRSALGDELRPLAEIHMTIAGSPMETVVTVADRSTLSTVALVGQADLRGFLVDSSARRLTTATAGHMSDMPCPDTGPLNASRAHYSAGATPQRADQMVLTVLPLALLVVVVCRSLIGIQTFGLFAPVLIAVTFLNSGLLTGAVVFGLVLLAGLLVHPLLARLRLARVPRMALLLIVVVLALLTAQAGLQRFLPHGRWAVSLPVVVAAMVIEQFWAGWERIGPADALKTATWTILVTAVTWGVLALSIVEIVADRAPFALILLSGGSCIVLGRYRGLRLVELWRFRSFVQQQDRELSVPSRLQP